MQGFIILAIIGTEKLIVTKLNGRTEIQSPASHPDISRCDKKLSMIMYSKLIGESSKFPKS